VARVQRGVRVLEHHLHLARGQATEGGALRQVAALEQHAAVVERGQADDAAADGGLAAAGFADDAQRLTAAQATGLLAFNTESRGAERDTLYYLVGIDNARFKQPVVPGDQLHLSVTVTKQKRGIWVFDSQATVDGKTAASAVIMCTERKIDS